MRGLAALATVKIREFGIKFYMSAVLANVKFDVVSCAFARFLEDVSATFAALD